MRYLFLICFLYPMILVAQDSEADLNPEVEKYNTLCSRYEKEDKFDSLVITYQQLMKLDHKYSKENQLDYHLACAAFNAKNYELGVKQAEKVLPLFYHRFRTRKSINKNYRYQALCFYLANYYHQTEDYKKEYRYISLINRKYDFLKCGTGKEYWRKNLYTRMIDCSDKLGKKHRVKRLEKKREALFSAD